MMDLRTRYLGLDLPHAFMPGASPLTESIDTVLRLEDAGAAAIVMNSLFQEEVVEYGQVADRYLERVLRIKQRTRLPVIASLNGTTAEGWLQYAQLLARAGADALELNFYHIPTDASAGARSVEARVVDITAVLKETIPIPVAIKLMPFYSSLPNLAAQLDRIGADGLVLFNRFYQADLNVETLEPDPQLELSHASELLMRLRFTAILHGRVRASLALSGGVSEGIHAVRSILAGADVVQVVSALIRFGPSRLAQIREDFERWGDLHGYRSIRDMRGLASLAGRHAPASFERDNYISVLHSWQGGDS
jgi:dihydroorotate dehydrogenase (fumarate)